MKLQFDANQTFQIDAIAAITDLFEGQPQGASEYSVINVGEWGGLFTGHDRTALGLGNRLLLSEEKLQANTRLVQTGNDIELDNPATPLEGWELFDTTTNSPRQCPHFSVEMETGTGKTYVYLRTIFELSRRFGFNKFIIVVPSVAIREGVLKNIEITADHFRTLYNNLPFEHFVYDARNVNRLRQFAVSNTLQIMVINIDAFRKNFIGTEAEQKSNVIYKENDQLSGRQPIEFVQAARPIVIIDEPQSVDSTEKAQEAIKALNPLCTLRYSATHRNLYNLVYRLDPVRAFELKLVKQIVVASAVAQGGANEAFVRVEKIDYSKGIKAKLRIQVQTGEGPKEKAVTIKNGADLYALSNERACYQDGFLVTEINAEPGNEYIRFENGRSLRLGEETGGLREDVWKTQIKFTIKKHLDKELQVKARGIKVLSLFFIDRVANYRGYDESGNPCKGKFAEYFESSLAELAKEERYSESEWLKLAPERLHNGYFAQDKKGLLKDTRGDTQADDDVYNLIMKDKERLLTMDEPLRFIFSHSALREGWDNPNVFQICTLNETRSAMKKRQEIGRGLRLPVDQNGLRVFDESVNRLYVMANESYEDFARTLQNEYEEDCGVTFGKIPLTALAKIIRIKDGKEIPVGLQMAEVLREALMHNGFLDANSNIQPAFDPKRPDFKLVLPNSYIDLAPAIIDLLSSYQIEKHIHRYRDEGVNRLKKEVQLSQEFQKLWARIKPRTTYRVEFDSNELIRRAVSSLKKMDRIEPPKIQVNTGQINVTKAGVATKAMSVSEEAASEYHFFVPDLLAYLQNETELTRSTLVHILKESGRLPEFFVDPQRFMDSVAKILKYELHRLLVDGIKYERIPATGVGAEWEMMLFKNEELINYLSALSVTHSVYEYVTYDSDIEREFAKKLDQREDIKLFVKLPDWFEIETPVGKYNPDWAIVKREDHTIYMVRETKANRDFLSMRSAEADKIRCGQRHFEAIDVSFKVAVSADEI
ncbi:MAG: DEAD/DEAH box helicase family protein [Desulfobacterales bacterium]|nr:DEAD/DEAH box helicase family protein [Desulfobacterales bacterium]